MFEENFVCGLDDDNCGFYDDDGTQINPGDIPRPSLCATCVKNDIEDKMERILCLLNRFDQIGEKEFKCFAFEPK